MILCTHKITANNVPTYQKKKRAGGDNTWVIYVLPNYLNNNNNIMDENY